jgi:hypothetical protein
VGDKYVKSGELRGFHGPEAVRTMQAVLETGPGYPRIITWH